jgi:TPR repeat protein
MDLACVDTCLGDITGALQLFRRGCELGEGAACGHAGSMLAAGEGAKAADPAAAAELFYEGCRLGHARSCFAQVSAPSPPHHAVWCVFVSVSCVQLVGESHVLWFACHNSRPAAT